MILVLTLLYVAVLLLAFRQGWLPRTLFWKLSPIGWVVLLVLVLFFPLQFWAPTGYVRVYQPTVQIVPNVSGQVVEVNVRPNQHVRKGDVLFRLDDRLYRARVERLRAEVTLAKLRYEQQLALFRKGVGRKADLDRTRAGLESAEARLDAAEYELEQTVVRAPGDGIVSNVQALRPGARLMKTPTAQAMVFIDDQVKVPAAQISQTYMHHIKPGARAEIAFKKYPGRVYAAEVEQVVPGSAVGQYSPSGTLVGAVQEVHAPQIVRLKIRDPELRERLMAGDTGNVAIYTEAGKAAHVIRKVIIRSTAIMNYILPF